MLNKEIGSSFYLLDDCDNELIALKQNKIPMSFDKFTIYHTGRNAYLALLKEISNKQKINKIWLPSYFCHNVINNISNNFNNVDFYYINPFRLNAKLNIEQFANQEDVVILNNFWGLTTYSYNLNPNDKPIIIEDHSHGWLSKQCIKSKADYCISSIRKTYPIPLGGITWQPNSNFPLNFYENTTDKFAIKAWEKLNESMSQKRNFIKGNSENFNKIYLSLLEEGESFVSKSNSYTKPNDSITNYIKHFIDLDPNICKKNNLQYVYKHLKQSDHFKVIKRRGYIAFGLLLVFKDENLFYSFKSYMILNNIYPANLWPQNDLKSNWKHLFNIHVDFRYSLDDMKFIVETINNWNQKNYGQSN
ncbi:hypothetical protein GCM10011531_15600 [Aquaticitalea lipolytica]|jgi:hypothetical protein|uniref:Uncharacterized protein n=1 Tax=Aquaticitalea lipolytica TaxID=1247562 RepID=A0A8J2XGT8_9FLAO|nr:hypothetical protein [Aquaticitalea lipolytica]GFZ85320.1 hypothetical protein GCM10011531_15600 [Aquaticitalea lipolytica]